MKQLVDRFGRTGFAALASVIWFFPMAAWAGSFDLSPIDKTAYPWIALTIGLVMLVVWIVLLTRLRSIPVSPRQRRFDLSQMTRDEKRWTLITIAFALGAIAWLNTAATVDWTPLVSGIGSGNVATVLFALALAVFLIVMVAGIAFSWRKESAAFQQRRARASLSI